MGVVIIGDSAFMQFFEDGPAKPYASGLFKEILPAGNPFPVTITWWDSPAKTKRILGKTLTYSTSKNITQIVWVIYKDDGVSALQTITDTIVYSPTNSPFESARTRVIS